MISEILQALQPWQGAIGSLIGSLLGFVALICGALFNFRLNRKRDAAMQAAEARSVAAALYGEILLLRREIANLANAIGREHHLFGTTRVTHRSAFDANFRAENDVSEARIYETLSSRIGLLRPDLIIAVAQFHSNVRQTKHWLLQLEESKDRHYSYSVSYALEPACDAVRLIEPALLEIEAILGVPTQVHSIRLDDADTSLEVERLFNSEHGN